MADWSICEVFNSKFHIHSAAVRSIRLTSAKEPNPYFMGVIQ